MLALGREGQRVNHFLVLRAINSGSEFPRKPGRQWAPIAVIRSKVRTRDLKGIARGYMVGPLNGDETAAPKSRPRM